MDTELVLRSAVPEDAPALLLIYAPYVRGTAVTFEYEVPSAAEFAGRIRSVLQRYPFLVAEFCGKLVGYAYAAPFKDRAAYDRSVETTVYVRQDKKRLGIGRRLYAALEDALRAQGILNLYACIAIPETADEYLSYDSAAFHARMGFRTVGTFQNCGCKFGRWYHMVWMEKLLGEHCPNPLPARLFGPAGADAPDYGLLLRQVRSFQEAEPSYVPLMANTAALLWESLPALNWAGFYIMRRGELELGPFQGKPACIRIALGKGVCGTAASENRVLRVPDVHAFPGHIACDSASRSELVLPLRQNGRVAAVLDLDSPLPDRFSPADEAGLRQLVAALTENIVFSGNGGTGI